MLDEIRELHEPVESYGSLECHGCDAEGYESEYPHWPCRTAELAYGADEVAEIEADFALFKRWMEPINYRRRMAAPPSPFASIISAAYETMIDNMLQATPFLRSFSEDGPTVTFTKVTSLQSVSKQMLED